MIMEHQSQSVSTPIIIKIRTIDNEFKIETDPSAKIQELKQKIELIANVPFERQRLIFRGKVLKNEDSLQTSKITHLDVIHLIAKIGSLSPSQNNNSSTHSRSSLNGNSFPSSSFSSFFQNPFISVVNNLSRRAGQTSSIPRSIRTSQESSRMEDESINREECYETIAQNVTTLQNMLSCGNYNEDAYKNNNFNFFNLDNRTLIKGQWVDVKDSVNTWLEAQIMDVDNIKREVFIHYIGWGSRWDEWIPMNSKRIMPFRFHTRQRELTNYVSPFPNFGYNDSCRITCKDNERKTEESDGLRFCKDIHEMLNEVTNINMVTTSLINKIKGNTDNNESDIIVEDEHSEHEKQKEYLFNMKQLMPLLDRVGRVYCDISTYVNSAIVNNKLSDLNEELFNRNVESNKELQPFNEEEKKKIKTEMLKGKTEREKRSLNFQTPPNEFCKGFINPIPLCDTPLNVSRYQQPSIDLYIHSFATSPISIPTNITTQTNMNTVNNNQQSNESSNSNSVEKVEDKNIQQEQQINKEEHETKNENKLLGRKRKNRKNSDSDNESNSPSNSN